MSANFTHETALNFLYNFRPLSVFAALPSTGRETYVVLTFYHTSSIRRNTMTTKKENMKRYEMKCER